MAALITRERATRNIAQAAFTALEEQLIDSMIAACSTAVESYCQRRFQVQQYDETYNGRMQRRLVLRNWPLQSVERVAYAPTPVLRVRNVDTAGNQRARVKVIDTGVTLTRVAAGVTTTASLAFADYLTLTALAGAIAALGSGWTASLLSPTYTSWPSDELRALQGSFDALAADAQLRVHASELNDFEVDQQRGWLLRSRSMEGYPYPPGSPTGLTWFGGCNYWRVLYTAGFDSVPEDVQEAVAQWAAAWFWQAKRDPGLRHDVLHGVYTRTPAFGMPENVQMLLAPYRTRKFLCLGS